MKLSECLLFLVACVGALLVVSPWPMAAQESTQASTECVKRDPNRQPPRKTFPSRRAGKGGGQREYEEPHKLKPVCSSGEVPRVIVHPRLPHYPKGNPLLGPYTGPLESVSSEFIIRNLVLPFDQVYWNGAKISETPYQSYPGLGYPRYFPVPDKLVRPGKNTIAVRIFTHSTALRVRACDVSTPTAPVTIGAWSPKAHGSKRI